MTEEECTMRDLRRAIAPHLRAARRVERRLFSIKFAESWGELKDALDGIRGAMRDRSKRRRKR